MGWNGIVRMNVSVLVARVGVIQRMAETEGKRLHAMSLSEASLSITFAALRLELDVAYYETMRGA